VAAVEHDGDVVPLGVRETTEECAKGVIWDRWLRIWIVFRVPHGIIEYNELNLPIISVSTAANVLSPMSLGHGRSGSVAREVEEDRVSLLDLRVVH
jgi:hypothetical protein